MTEKDLKELKFKKNKVPGLISGDKNYYYYTYEFKKENSQLDLISIDSDTVENPNSWDVHIFEANLKPFTKKSDVIKYIQMIRKFEK